MVNTYFPFIGISSISFGSNRQLVHAQLNSNYKVFLRNELAENTSDYYFDLGFFVEYDKSDLCQAIEFTTKSNLFFNDGNLMTFSYSELRKKYDKLSSKKEEEEEVGVTYYDLGFGLSKVFNSDTLEAICIFSKDYW